MRRIKLSIIIVTAFFVSFIPFYSQALSHKGSCKILVVNSYHKGYLWSDRIMEGIDSVFASINDSVAYYEYLDTKRNSSPEYMEYLKKVFLLKYSKNDFNIIILSDDNAFNFILQFRNTIFKNVPIVFCGINNYDPSMIKGYADITGIAEYYNPSKTQQAAQLLFPEKDLYISICDNTESGLINQKLFVDSAKNLPKNIRLEFWQNLSSSELEEKMKNAPFNSVLFYTDFNRDGDGKVISTRDAELFISKSKAPVFGRQEWLLGKGLFGGMIVSGYYQGQTAAQMAISILNGKNAGSIPVVAENANRYMFDYRVMNKYNIKISDLPKDSIVINKPSSFFDFYRKNRIYVLGTGLVFMMIIVVILSVALYKISSLSRERKNLVADLSDSIKRIKRIDGLLPICAVCKKIRNDKGYWEQIEDYIKDHSSADFSHSLCRDCANKLYPDMDFGKDDDA
ncbi:MAG TPA: ABC transporter substrate binding protein [Spirochaetota bacterium]|nr:ABC transporter substrate binding protein [Spirochaetota bacterium]